MNFYEKIVLVGGGGGVYQTARYLKDIRPNITTIQTSFDNGGHSGKLRDERGMLPPGDIRQAILALADDSKYSIIRNLLSHRFEKKNKSSLDDVSVGNVLLTALTEITGSLPAAIAQLSDIAGVPQTMRVLPVSLDSAHLVVTFDDGTTMKGEGLIDNRDPGDRRRIVSAHLDPKANIFVKAHEALVTADKIVFCQGSYWTSLIPNPLVCGFKEALSATQAKLMMVVNIMTNKTETDGYTSADFVNSLCDYIGRSIHVAICNNGRIPDHIAQAYAKEGSFPVKLEYGFEADDVVTDDLVDVTGGIIRHHKKVAQIIAEL